MSDSDSTGERRRRAPEILRRWPPKDKEDSPDQKNKKKKQKEDKPAQKAVNEFWAKFNSKHAVSNILPRRKSAAAKLESEAGPIVTEHEAVTESYDRAAKICREKVESIVKECRRTNQKFADPEFIVERQNTDSLWPLNGVAEFGPDWDPRPKAAKRVADIFENPKFFMRGSASNDIRQGRVGNCWLMSSLCAMGNQPGLIDKLCIARDEAVGVYGFVFYRDGEWISEIVDDRLFLKMPDYARSQQERANLHYVDEVEDRRDVTSEEAYRKLYQTGSGALYFGKCQDPNETWLPLLEKAYAKAHGDYYVTVGGWPGEGVEDLTGGVTTKFRATGVLDKDHLWNNELCKVNKEFLFTYATERWDGQPIPDLEKFYRQKGLVGKHAYTVMKAVEMNGKRLLLMRNPWGRMEWSGSWGDRSKEWTAEWMLKLDHKFGDDGNFWMEYSDFLQKYQTIERIRLFTDEWKVAQKWTALQIPWVINNSKTKFAFEIDKRTEVVILLTKLDDRYYRGLEGKYRFDLSFIVQKAGSEEHVLSCSYTQGARQRSISAELTLDAGEYHVLMKVEAEEEPEYYSVERMIRKNAQGRAAKLQRIAQSYEKAHAKAAVEDKAFDTETQKKINTARREKLVNKTRKRMLKDKKRQKHVENKAKRRKCAAKARKLARAEAIKIVEEVKEGGVLTTPAPNMRQHAKSAPRTGAIHSTRSKTRNENNLPDPSLEPQLGSKADKELHEAEVTVNNPTKTSRSNRETAQRLKSETTAKQDTTVLEDDDDCDIDSDVSDISTDGVEEELEKRKLNTKTEKMHATQFQPPQDDDDEEDEGGLFSADPWKADVTVGLRVYVKEGGVKMRVIREEWVDLDTEEEGELDSGEDREEIKKMEMRTLGQVRGRGRPGGRGR